MRNPSWVYRSRSSFSEAACATWLWISPRESAYFSTHSGMLLRGLRNHLGSLGSLEAEEFGVEGRVHGFLVEAELQHRPVVARDFDAPDLALGRDQEFHRGIGQAVGSGFGGNGRAIRPSLRLDIPELLGKIELTE